MANKSEWYEIKTVDQFKQIIGSGEGFIVITDNANPNRVHDIECSHLSEGNFITKVIKHKNRNGYYYWIRDMDKGKDWNAIPCSKCL